MQIFNYRPDAPLVEYIELIWFGEGEAQPGVCSKTLPQGSVTLVFNLSQQAIQIAPSRGSQKRVFTDVCVSGVYDKPYYSYSRRFNRVLGVHFKPGGAPACLGMPTTELLNTHINGAELQTQSFACLHSLLLQTESPSSCLGLTEAHLHKRLQPQAQSRFIRWACEFLRHPSASLQACIARSGYSQRQFSRLFSHHVGISPKLFQRIQRFQSVLAVIEKSRDLSALAHNQGYYDQSHLLRDFKQFAALAPSQYTSKTTGRLNHLLA